jgi:hypothetical protein
MIGGIILFILIVRPLYAGLRPAPARLRTASTCFAGVAVVPTPAERRRTSGAACHA